MGSSENQFLMLHVKWMVIFLFLLRDSFAVWTMPVCIWTFQNNCLNAFPVRKLLAATTFHTTRRRLRVWLFPRHSTLAHYRDLLNKKWPPVSTLGYFRAGKGVEWPTLQALKKMLSYQLPVKCQITRIEHKLHSHRNCSGVTHLVQWP